MVAMKSPKRPNTIFHERKKYLLAELQVIDVAILNARQSEDALDWMKRLQKWRSELQALVENMPEP
jgi:hypothetical protein